MTYPLSPSNHAKKKTSFIPKLAFGSLSLGAGVIPLIIAASGCGDADTDAIHPALIDGTAPDGVAVRFQDASPFEGVHIDATIGDDDAEPDPADAAADAADAADAEPADAAGDAGEAADASDADAGEH